MKKLILTIFIFLLCVVPSFADTHVAETCDNTATHPHVQTAVDEAVRGDTVTVPSGSCTWSVEVSVTKAIRIQGAGIDTTTITSGMTSGDGYTTSKFLFRYIPSSPSDDENVIFELTGFTFSEGGITGSGSIIVRNESATPIRKVRIHHNKIINSHAVEETSHDWSGSIVIEGTVYGVVDNNTITGMPRVGNFGRSNASAGRDSWDDSTFEYGSPNNMYWEDNTFTKNTYVDIAWRQLLNYCDRGGRYVFRYNTIINSTNSPMYLWDMHGVQIGGTPTDPSYRNRSTMGAEIYGNSITHTGNYLHVWNQIGGRLLAFYNYVNNGVSGYEISGNNTNYASEWWAPTDHVCTGQSFTYDGTVYTDYSSCSSDGQRQMVTNSYYFNNRKASTGGYISYFTRTNSSYNQWGGNKIVENTHYWKDATAVSGKQSIGVGCGTYANIPASCEPETGYWATDQSCANTTNMVGVTPTTPISGALYRCYPQNVWTKYYEPYPYCHSLRVEMGDVACSADATVPAIKNMSPTQEIACNGTGPGYTDATATISLQADDQTPPVTCKWDTSVDGTPTYAELTNTFTPMGESSSTHSATATGLTCGGATTIYYACTDSVTPANVNAVASWSFNIADGADTDEAVITNIGTTNQAKAIIQRIDITTSKQATCRWCANGVDGCDLNTAYASMKNTFSQTIDMMHHDVSVTQAASSTTTYYIRCLTTQLTANSSSTSISITTDALKTISTTGGTKSITIGTGDKSFTIVP